MRLVVSVLTLVLLAGCTGGAAPPPKADPSATTAGLRDRCLSAVPARAPIRSEDEVTGPGISMPVAVIGPATRPTTVLVLLHQVSGGACGWGRFATAAAGRGVTSVLADLCGYADSDCTEAADRDVVAQVQALVSYARRLGGDRVVLVGASMGGSQAVRAVAGGVRVDGWVDVSGPSSWDGTRLLDLAARVPDGGLVVHARSDGATLYRSARQLARRTGARFVDGGSGHGYELLTSYRGRLLRGGRTVLDYARTR